MPDTRMRRSITSSRPGLRTFYLGGDYQWSRFWLGNLNGGTNSHTRISQKTIATFRIVWNRLEQHFRALGIDPAHHECSLVLINCLTGIVVSVREFRCWLKLDKRGDVHKKMLWDLMPQSCSRHWSVAFAAVVSAKYYAESETNYYYRSTGADLE